MESVNVIFEDRWEDLANAVVEQAAWDYISLLKRRWKALNCCDLAKYREINNYIRDVEGFFESPQYILFTKLDGSLLKKMCYKKAFVEYREKLKSKQRNKRKIA